MLVFWWKKVHLLLCLGNFLCFVVVVVNISTHPCLEARSGFNLALWSENCGRKSFLQNSAHFQSLPRTKTNQIQLVLICVVSHSHVVSFWKSFLIILSKIRAHPLFLAVVVRRFCLVLIIFLPFLKIPLAYKNV